MTGASRAFRRSNEPRIFSFPAASTVAASHNVKISTFIIQATSHRHTCISLKATNTRGQNSRQIADWDSLLFHRIALSQRHGIAQFFIFLAERFEIHGDAKWRTNFVLATITPADRTTLVVEDKHVRSQQIDDLFRFYHQSLVVFEQRKYSAFDRRHPWVETQDNACFLFSFFIGRLIFGIRFTNERQHGAVHARTRFDYVRNKSLLRLFIEILERFAAGLLVL